MKSISIKNFLFEQGTIALFEKFDNSTLYIRCQFALIDAGGNDMWDHMSEWVKINHVWHTHNDTNSFITDWYSLAKFYKFSMLFQVTRHEAGRRSAAVFHRWREAHRNTTIYKLNCASSICLAVWEAKIVDDPEKILQENNGINMRASSYCAFPFCLVWILCMKIY